MKEILAVQQKCKIMMKPAQKLISTTLTFDETRFCSNGSWIDRNSAISK